MLQVQMKTRGTKLVAKTLAAFVLVGSPACSDDAAMARLAKDFSTVCVKELPDIKSAVKAAERAGFRLLQKGDIPELDEAISADEGWLHLLGVVDPSTFVDLRLTEKQLSPVEAEVFSAGTASLCGMDVAGPSADAAAFETSLTKAIRLGLPTLDIMNSGHRELSWDIYVAYNRSSLVLKGFDGPVRSGFSIFLIVPHQVR